MRCPLTSAKNRELLPRVVNTRNFIISLNSIRVNQRNAPKPCVRFCRYWKILCDVTEYRAGGVCIRSSEARMSRNGSDIMISGKFNREISPEFQLTLSTSLTNDDRRRGYLYVGALKQGRLDSLVTTHFAAVSLYQRPTRPDLS